MVAATVPTECLTDVPSIESIICTLSEFREKKNAEGVKRIHVRVSSYGLDSHLAIGNYFISLYAECAHVSNAEQIFHCMKERNEYSWTSLIQGHVECGKPERAFELFRTMKEEGFSPSTYTFVALLKACGKISSVDRGQTVHAEIVEKDFELDPFVGSSLVHMYFKLGMFQEAQDVLDSLPERDVVLWTALITGYVEQGLSQEALFCLNQMQLEGMSPDPVTYVSCLKACGILGAVDKGSEIHSSIIMKGFDENIILSNALIDMYGKCGMVSDARKVFDRTTDKDIISWNSLVAGYAECGFGEEVLNLLQEMRLMNVQPDAITFMCCLKACNSIGASKKGRDLHAEIVKEGYEEDPFIGSALVDFYAKSGALLDARATFDEMTVHDLVTWTTLTTGYANHGLDDEVLACFCQMKQEGVPLDMVLVSTVMFCYAEQGEIEKTIKQYLLALEHGLLPTNSAAVSILVACGNSEALYIGKKVHAQVHGVCFSDVILATAILDMYCKCGSMIDAYRFFNMFPSKTVAVWNTLMTGYAHHGMGDHVFELIDQMNEGSFVPDKVTFLSVISACNHLGLIDRGLKYFEDMINRGIFPAMKHYSCVVDLLCRAGRLEEAVTMVEKMPIKPTLVIWHILLSACHKWGNAELGRHVFKHARQLDVNHGAAYILMSNIYADTNMWEDAGSGED